jgi:hypothetical protein
VAGSALLFISSLLIYIFRDTFIYSRINHLWYELAPFNYSGRTSLALILGIGGALFLNQFSDEEEEISRVVYDKQNPLEILLREAMGGEDLIALSVSSGKVYVGFITSNFNPAFAMEAVSLMPSLSGYRKDDTKEVVFTLDYSGAYNKIRQEVEQKIGEMRGRKPNNKSEEEWESEIGDEIEDEMDLKRFLLVIPVSEIQSAFIFDPDIYEKHFRSEQLIPADPAATEEPSRSVIFSLFTITGQAK